VSIWPIHPQPKNDELLSSWMVRLAHANHYKAHDFYCQYFGKERQIWNRDIDHFAPNWLLNGLSIHTGVSIERLRQMSLRSLEGLAFELYNETGVTRGLLSVGIYHRIHRTFGQQFCPVCLLEDEHPYLRKVWRLAFVTVCEHHHVILHDRCEHCAKPMMPYRADMKSRYGSPQHISMEFCGCCGKRFTKNNIVVAEPEFLEFQKLIYKSISSGFTLFGGENLYSFLFFEGIRTLVQGIGRTERTKERIHSNKIVFEMSHVNLRHQLLSGCANLLRDWPHEFIVYLAKHKQPYSNFVSRNTNGTAPYWIDKVLKSAM